VQLLAPIQHELAIARVQVLDPELEDAEPLPRLRRNATDLAESVVGEEDAAAVVRLV
jgi:hypothetical protein